MAKTTSKTEQAARELVYQAIGSAIAYIKINRIRETFENLNIPLTIEEHWTSGYRNKDGKYILGSRWFEIESSGGTLVGYGTTPLRALENAMIEEPWFFDGSIDFSEAANE